MKYAVLILTIISAIVIYGCADRASELFETAKFEELQNNKEHAKELYEEIIKKYPRSKYAKKAEKGLAELKKKSPVK